MNNKIICDLDDTLSFTLNRDFENATPNLALIEKLNKLSAKGYEVHIVTARGQISCNGDSKKASEKYRGQILNWLDIHNVSWVSLSFEKKLARYYIDDKAISPEKFLELEFDSVGKSGAHITMDTEFVYKEFKTFEEAQSLIDWSNKAEDYTRDRMFSISGLIIIPKIHTLIGNEIKMDRLRDLPHTLESLKRVFNLALIFSNFKPQFKQNPMLYFQNIFSHLQSIGTGHYEVEFTRAVSEKLMGESSMLEMLNSLSKNKSFSHGDYTIQNVLNVGDYNIGLIDPIHSENKYSSYLLDLAKLKWSLILEKDPTWLDYFNKEVRGIGPNFNNLVICEGIRTLKYCVPSEKLYRMEIIEELCLQENR